SRRPLPSNHCAKLIQCITYHRARLLQCASHSRLATSRACHMLESRSISTRVARRAILAGVLAALLTSLPDFAYGEADVAVADRVAKEPQGPLPTLAED